MNNTYNCPLCDSPISAPSNPNGIMLNFYECPVCGRFELGKQQLHDRINENHLASFLFYNRFHPDDDGEYRYHTVLEKEKCDEYKKDFDRGDISHGRPVHMDATIVDNWYPKTFADRVDCILLYLAQKSVHVGQRVSLSATELLSLLFVDRKEKSMYSSKIEWRQDFLCTDEAGYMLDYLLHENYIMTDAPANRIPPTVHIVLTPRGYSRVDTIQKNNSHGSHALVAMKFGEDTKILREAIRKGVGDAGYNAVFIDEVQHNDFITPELLKYIRDSKFVVVDLTHQNNGAYFEEGYAMGLGKPVIQLCKRDTKLHFDIAQKNTIIWAAEDEIPERLTNRIKATID